MSTNNNGYSNFNGPSDRYYGTDKEQMTFWKIGKNLDPSDYLMENAIIPCGNGKSAEVDAIVVSTKGIIVIEIKNRGGSFYGRDGDEKWTQVIGKQTYQLKNPIKQNKYHCDKLYEALGRRFHVANVVIFDGRIGHDGIESWGKNVLDVETFIKLFSRAPQRMSEKDKREVFEILTRFRATNGKMDNHVKRLIASRNK